MIPANLYVRRFNNIIIIIIVLLTSMALVFKSDSMVAYVFCAVLELGTEISSMK